MFNKLKQIKDLRSQAKNLQNTLAKEIVETEHKGISLVMNGNLEITSLKISEDAKKNLEENLRDCFNESVKKTQKASAKKMQEMGGFGDLGNFLK